jgi:flagellar basal-body rod protein FlgB
LYTSANAKNGNLYLNSEVAIMADILLLDNTLRLLEKTLSWRSQGQAIISGNLANLETPDYLRKGVNFQGVLKDYIQGRPLIKLASTNPQHLIGSPVERGLIEETNDPVDLDQEMVNLSVNQLGYQTSVTMLNKKFDQLKTVIGT